MLSTMVKLKAAKQSIAPTRGQPAAIRVSPDNETILYFNSSRQLQSHDPALRRPAIATMTALARQATTPISRRASAILEDEFGPFAVSHGLPGCSAPLSEVVRCDAEGRDCRACPWVWYNDAFCPRPAC
jgi:hypothetical protein